MCENITSIKGSFHEDVSNLFILKLDIQRGVWKRGEEGGGGVQFYIHVEITCTVTEKPFWGKC